MYSATIGTIFYSIIFLFVIPSFFAREWKRTYKISRKQLRDSRGRYTNKPIINYTQLRQLCK